MRKRIFLYLSCLLLLSGLFISCNEVTEEDKFHDWQPRNEAFIDSLDMLNPVLVQTEAEVLAVPVGTLFKIFVPETSIKDDPQFVYCKKITPNTEGERPLYTQSFKAFYYGTLITGDKFNGNFNGYSALDKTFSGEKDPTEFDSSTAFEVAGVIKGWEQAVQYMRTGERWMLYVPWKSAYGVSGYGSIPGYSTLAFDLKLVSVVE